MLSSPAAQAQALCGSYEVSRGDTLGRIATRAGVPGGYKALYAVNRDVLSSPHVMEVGQILRIPCADGSVSEQADASVVSIAEPVTVQETAAAPAPKAAPAEAAPIVFLTGSGFAPFTDEDLPEGGAITQMVKRSLALAAPEREIKVVFVNDWGAHLGDLLPTPAFDAGFPWSIPDCTKVALLSEPNARRCTQFDHSDPFYEEGVSYYTLAASPLTNATTPEALHGSTICRPDGWFSFDLEGRGLTAPNVEIVWPGDQLDCWSMLQAGEVDLVTYDTQVVEEDIRELGIGEAVVEMEALKGSTKMGVFVPKDHPNGAEIIAVINEGLSELRMSGEWFTIVREQVQATVMN